MTVIDLAQAAWVPIAELAVEFGVPVGKLYSAGVTRRIALRRQDGRWYAQVFEVRAFASSLQER
jgi:hypothetical protein